MPNFTNLQEVGLYRSKRIVEKASTIQNGDFIYNLIINYSGEPAKLIFKSKIMIDRVFYTQERINTLIDNTVNYINEFVLSSIDNKAYHLKNMLKQPNKVEFIRAMLKEIDIYE